LLLVPFTQLSVLGINTFIGKLQALTPINLSKYLNRHYLKNKTTLAESIVPSNWLLVLMNISLYCTTKRYRRLYDVLLRYSDIEESYGLPPLIKPVIANTEIH
jgi:hypothetical protein